MRWSATWMPFGPTTSGANTADASGRSGPGRTRSAYVRFGLTGIPPGVREKTDLPARQEYWLPVLAARLGVKPIVVHRWR